MWLLLNISIIAITIAFLPVNDPFLSIKQALFTVLCLSIISIGLSDKRNKYYTFSNQWLSYIFLFSIIQFGFLFYMPFLFSKDKVIWNLWNYIPALNIITSIFLLQTLVERSDSIGRHISIAKLLVWLSFALSCYAILQFCGVDQIFNKNLIWQMDLKNETSKSFVTYRMVTFFGNSMQTATFLAVLSPLCLMFRQLRYKLIYVTIAIAVCLTHSLLGIIALISGYLVYILFTKKLIVFISMILSLIVICLSILYLYPDIFTLYGKLELYKSVFLKSLDTIFTGTGIGSFANLRYIVSNSHVNDLGFEPLQIFQEGGIILLALVIAYLIDLFKRIINSKETMLLICTLSSFISFLIVSCGGYTLRLPYFALIGILLIASLETQTLWKGE